MLINVIDALVAVGINELQAKSFLESGSVFTGPKSDRKVVKTQNIEVNPGEAIHIPGQTHIYFVGGGPNMGVSSPPKALQPSRSEEPIAALPADITLENYLAKTGHRFKMTKAEVEAGLSREDAFKRRFFNK